VVDAVRETVTRVELDELGRRLWATLSPGAVVWLTGELGSGKTALVQAIALAAGAEHARSPTFALVHEYPSPAGLIIHADCFRLRQPDDAVDIDFADLQRRARLLLIEWPENAGTLAPPPDLHLSLAHDADPDRRIVERVP